MKDKPHLKGAILTIIGAIFWGVSGTFGQFLFENKSVSPQWLVTIRLLIAGLLLLIFTYKKEGKDIFKVWKSKGDVVELVLFSIFGMLSVQFTYFVAIQKSNAATATVLQYLGPAIIMVYLSLKNKKIPTYGEFAAIFCAMFGTFILATHGNIQVLTISASALFWGVASAVALAFYSIQPGNLLKKWGSSIVIGWGMLIGGILLSFIYVPWKTSVELDDISIGSILFIIIFGTLIAFNFYLEGVRFIGATKASLLACVEPLSATIFSVLWLKVSFEVIDFIGFFFIISTVFLLSMKSSKKNTTNETIEIN